MASTKHIEQLASEKEQELVSLRQQHAQLVQETLKSVENELACEQQKLQQLQADFEYNLSLLEQRDSELVRYDCAFAEVRKAVNTLTAENSELRVRVDSLQAEAARHNEDYQQLKGHYIRRIEELQTQLDAYRRLKDSEVDKEREKLEESQRKLQQRLLEIDLETQQQREHITADFDQLMRQRDHEHELKVDELNAAALRHEAHARQLQRELKVSQCSQESAQEERKGKEEDVGRLEKLLKQKEWEKEDVERMAEARTKELEGRLAQSQTANDSLQNDFMKRHAEMDRLVREKESCLRAAKEAHEERENELERGLRELGARLEEKEVDIRRLQWAHKDALAERDSKLERSAQQEKALLAQARAKEEELLREGVAKDLQIQALQDSYDKLQQEAVRSSKSLKQCQQELSQSVGREQLSQEIRTKLEHDWQCRAEEVRRQSLAKQEGSIKRLTTARDRAQTEVKEIREVLSRRSEALREVQRERDAAIATLNKHGLATEEECGLIDDVQRLKQQNAELHSVIKQMRVEMEAQLEAEQRPNAAAGSTVKDHSNLLLTPGYVQYMEHEVMQLKSEKHQLQEQVREMLAAKKPPTPPPHSKQSTAPPPPPSKTTEQQHRAHLVALSDTIAGLQGEKAQRELECMQLRGTVERLEEKLTLLQEKVYVLKACQVPQSKLHQKLLCATQVIISLVKEKDLLSQQLKVLSQSAAIASRHGGRGRRSPEPMSVSEDDASKKQQPCHLARQSLKKPGSSTTPAPPIVVPKKNVGNFEQQQQSTSIETTPLSQANSSLPRATEVGRNLDQMSLHSLRFSESSDEQQLSVEKLFEMVEPGDTSSTVLAPHEQAPQHSPPRGSSTPRGRSSQFHSMELRGKPVQTHSRGGAPQILQRNLKAERKRGAKQLRPKPRNYNVKDDS